jgi:hypothetical protein
VGPRAVLDAVAKRKIPSPRRESNPRTPIGQPVATFVILYFHKNNIIQAFDSYFTGSLVNETLFFNSKGYLFIVVEDDYELRKGSGRMGIGRGLVHQGLCVCIPLQWLRKSVTSVVQNGQ